MNVGFYLIIFQYTKTIGEGSGWDEDKFFLFLATTWFINSLVQAFFMPNAEEFSELIRTGGLDFALLKPIDTQFLVSFQRVDWSALTNFLAGLVIAAVSLHSLADARDQPDDSFAVIGDPVCRFRRLRRGDYVQPDDLPECDQHLARPQSNAVQLLVLHHQLQPLSDGDVQSRMGHAAVRILHFRRPGAAGGERPGTIARQANRPENQRGMAACRLGPRGNPAERAGKPLGFPESPVELPKCEFVTMSATIFHRPAKRFVPSRSRDLHPCC